MGIGVSVNSIDTTENFVLGSGGIKVNTFIDTPTGTAISVGSYIKSLVDAISIAGDITCGDGPSGSLISNNCV